jgi:hypothetical protein
LTFSLSASSFSLAGTPWDGHKRFVSRLCHPNAVEEMVEKCALYFEAGAKEV